MTDRLKAMEGQEKKGQGLVVAQPQGSNYRSRRLAGTASIRWLFPRLSPTEVATLNQCSRPMLGRELAAVTPGGLPEPLQAGEGVQVRLGALPVPEGAVERLAALAPRERALYVRAALARVGAEHASERWVLDTAIHPGTQAERERISVGPGRWVTHAIWRRADGTPRAGDRGPATLLRATTGQLVTHAAGDPFAVYAGTKQELFELIGEDWRVLQVFPAQSLDHAAQIVIEGEDRAGIDPARLTRQRAAELGRKKK